VAAGIKLFIYNIYFNVSLYNCIDECHHEVFYV